MISYSCYIFHCSLYHCFVTSVQSLADSCFPVSNGPVSGRLHGIFFPTMSGICLLHLPMFQPVILLSYISDLIEFFLRQFCDAHTCTRGPKPFSKGKKVEFAVILNCSNFVFLSTRSSTH